MFGRGFNTKHTLNWQTYTHTRPPATITSPNIDSENLLQRPCLLHLLQGRGCVWVIGEKHEMGGQFILSCNGKSYSMSHAALSNEMPEYQLHAAALPEKHTVPRLVNTFPAFYGTTQFITVSTRAHRLNSVSQTDPVHDAAPYLLKIHLRSLPFTFPHRNPAPTVFIPIYGDGH